MTFTSPCAPSQPCLPAVVAFELLAMPKPAAKQCLSLRVLMDAAAARLMISGMTGASTGVSYSNGQVAYWMATILSTYYEGNGYDLEWSDSKILADKPAYGSAFAERGALETIEGTASAMRAAAARLVEQAGHYCLVEYGYCDVKGQDASLSDWAGQRVDQVIGRVSASESMATTYMVFTDQRAAFKNAKAEAHSLSLQSMSPQAAPSDLIAAALALEPNDD